MSDPPKEEPDAAELTMRFGCGALVGAIFAFAIFVSGVPISTGAIVLLFAGLILLFGFLSARFGDRFWLRLLAWFQWPYT